MNRREIQIDRTRRYFLDAAKDIIRAEGVRNLTTKKIGERAAYSNASLYNYFENFNELVCRCMEEMAAERAAWVAGRLAGTDPEARVLDFARLMVEANAAEPNGYSVFLSTDIDYGYFRKRDGHPFVHPAYALLLEELSALPGLAGKPDDARTLADILAYVFHSKLHFYIRYGTPSTLEALTAEIGKETAFLLERVRP